jgi:hypothetical protein
MSNTCLLCLKYIKIYPAHLLKQLIYSGTPEEEFLNTQALYNLLYDKK